MLFLVLLQAAEKSLKAAWYAKDANELVKFKKSHNLESIASGKKKVLHFFNSHFF